MDKTIFLEHILDPDNQAECVAVARALCPFAETMTDMGVLVCVCLVEAKGNEDILINEMGLSKVVIRRHYQSRLGSQIIKKLTKHRVNGSGYVIAANALMDVASSASTSPAARNKAASALIQLNKEEEEDGRKIGGEGVELSNMTYRQLEQLVSSIKQDMTRPNAPLVIDNE